MGNNAKAFHLHVCCSVCCHQVYCCCCTHSSAYIPRLYTYLHLKLPSLVCFTTYQLVRFELPLRFSSILFCPLCFSAIPILFLRCPVYVFVIGFGFLFIFTPLLFLFRTKIPRILFYPYFPFPAGKTSFSSSAAFLACRLVSFPLLQCLRFLLVYSQECGRLPSLSLSLTLSLQKERALSLALCSCVYFD